MRGLSLAAGLALAHRITQTNQSSGEPRTAKTVEEKPRLDSAHHRSKWLRRFYTGYIPRSNEECKRTGFPHQGRQEMLRRQMARA